MTRTAWGAGLSTIATDGTVLDAWYRWYGWGEYGDDAMMREHAIDEQLGLRDEHDDMRNVTIRPVRITIDVDEAPGSVADGYLRLHLLSSRMAAPHSINMDGIFGALTNVAWTDLGPVPVGEIMTTDLVTADPTMSTLDAIRLMRDRRVSCLPVVDKSMRLVGIVTERDFMSIAGQLLEAYLS